MKILKLPQQSEPINVKADGDGSLTYKLQVMLSDRKARNGHACCCDIIITEVTMFDLI